MCLVFSTPGENSFESIRAEIERCKELIIVTYNIDYGAEDLITLLRSRPPGSNLTVYANISGRWTKYFDKAKKENARKAIAKALDALNPKKFQSKVDIHFCFENHAKIIICDGKVDRTHFSGPLGLRV
jgi:hypothetical protein